MKKWIYSSAILAFSIIVLGLCLKCGIDDFANKDRKVTVKGLAEKEVEADKVTWPILFKETGNDLPALYDDIANKQARIIKFLHESGLNDKDITINASKVVDLNADQQQALPLRHHSHYDCDFTQCQTGKGHYSQAKCAPEAGDSHRRGRL